MRSWRAGPAWSPAPPLPALGPPRTDAGSGVYRAGPEFTGPALALARVAGGERLERRLMWYAVMVARPGLEGIRESGSSTAVRLQESAMCGHTLPFGRTGALPG